MGYRWCDNYARGILRCHLARGDTLFFVMEEKICSFFGHRDVNITEQLYAATLDKIMNAIEFGCSTFYFGGYGDFDNICLEIVTKIKTENPNLKIRRIYCVSQERYLRKSTRYFNCDSYDEIIYLTPSFDGWYKSIYFRNCAMIDQSDFIIFYAESRETSGAYKAYKYAKRKTDKQIINLWEN